MCVSVLTLGLALGGSAAYAKDKTEDPAGWAKGEKKGWKGSEVPPGLANKKDKVKGEAEKAEKSLDEKRDSAEKEARKAEKKADKEAKKAQKKAEKEAKKAQKKAEKEAKKQQKEADKAKKRAEKEASQKAEETHVAAGM